MMENYCKHYNKEGHCEALMFTCNAIKDKTQQKIDKCSKNKTEATNGQDKEDE